jgi:hypothetical protein
MDKPAQVVIRFDKTIDNFWPVLVDAVDPTTVREAGNVVIILVDAKDYKLTDHQFIQLKMNLHKREMTVHLPRSLVTMIVEGKSLGKNAFGFLETAKESSN